MDTSTQLFEKWVTKWTLELDLPSGKYVVSYVAPTMTVKRIDGPTLLLDNNKCPYAMTWVQFDDVASDDVMALLDAWLESSGALLPHIKPVVDAQGKLHTAWSLIVNLSGGPDKLMDAIARYRKDWHRVESGHSLISNL